MRLTDCVLGNAVTEGDNPKKGDLKLVNALAALEASKRSGRRTYH